ncbi:MAG: hypothetical protein GF375_06020, partial [Candidatus Omnitrophica bacterium]|nr:hypothetical protein [Candidatus Omnitrophota bacterium]MBD3269532.1 hypothetical protein [Candidatus Omnitrophota bacterium]
RVFLGGNIGVPLSSFVLNTSENDLIVLELSSFQLETVDSFRPHIAALLNIEPDHFDRYSNFSDYLGAKMNIFKNQQSSDWAVVNKSLSACGIPRRMKAAVVEFSKEFPDENFSCVYKIASILGLKKHDCLEVFSSFRGLSHRLQFVRNIEGVAFINDSKATNPSSTVWALKNTGGPIILLAGGKDKGLDYSVIVPYLKKVKKINLFGEAAEKIKKTLTGYADIEIFTSLKELVDASLHQASGGDKILFSPMCSSYDMFSDYKHRGNSFMGLVKKL